MAATRYQLREGLCECTVSDPKAGSITVPVLAVGGDGALIETKVSFDANECVDVMLQLSGEGEENLFAQVVSSGDEGLLVKWMHFDASEGKRLAELIDNFAEANDLEATGSGVGKAQKHKTRKVVRPRKQVSNVKVELDDADDGDNARKTRKITKPAAKAPDDDKPADVGYKKTKTEVIPFGGGAGGEATPLGSKTLSPASDAIERTGTRRVIKPRADAGPIEPSPSTGASTSSRTRRVVKPTQSSDDLSPTASPTPASSDGGRQQSAPAGDGQQSKTKRFNVRGSDGKIDVGASIRSRAKTVSAKELASKHDKLRVLDMRTIKELIQDAVEETIGRLGGALDQKEKERLLHEAEEEFQERLKAFKAEKAGLEAQTKNLEDQLKRAERLLEEEKAKTVSADQFTMSERGMEDMEKRFQRLITAAAKSGSVEGAMADDLRKMVNSLLDEEREKIAEQARKAQNEAIALLEKKVKRLSGSLEDAEKERDMQRRRAAALEASGGGVIDQKIFSDLETDEDKERKLELLKHIFDENKEMRGALKSMGVKIKSRKKPTPIKAAEPAEGEAEGDKPAEAEAAADEAPEAVAEETRSDEEVAASYDEVDPDDMPWQPGMSFSKEVAGDNELDDEDEDDGVKKLTNYKNFKPPPLTGAGGDDGANESDTAAASADESADSVDPDDMPWEPGMSFSREVAGDNEEEDDSPVKKLTDFKNFAPPPLERKG